MSDQKNMLIAIAISLAILLGFQFFYEFPKLEKEKERQAQIAAQEKSQLPAPSKGVNNTDIQAPGGGVSAPGVKSEVLTAQKRTEALNSVPRIGIDTPTLVGSISLIGARLDDLVLKQYGQSVEENSGRIHLLHPILNLNFFVDFLMAWNFAAARGAVCYLKKQKIKRVLPELREISDDCRS